MKVIVLNADTGEVEVVKLDTNNPEMVMDFVVKMKESYNLTEEETNTLTANIFSTDLVSNMVGEA